LLRLLPLHLPNATCLSLWGSLRTTLLDKSSSWRMTCPAHLNLLSLQNFILTTQLVEFLVSSNSPASLIHHWAVNSPEDFALKDTKTMFILFR
jgi:hypothetical protein